MNISSWSTYVHPAAFYIIILSLDRALLMFYLMLSQAFERDTQRGRKKTHKYIHKKATQICGIFYFMLYQ